MSEIHAAAAAQHSITLSRLDELQTFLQANLTGPNFDRASALLRAVFSPEFSAALHVADAVPPPPPVFPLPEGDPPTRRARQHTPPAEPAAA